MHSITYYKIQLLRYRECQNTQTDAKISLLFTLCGVTYNVTDYNVAKHLLEPMHLIFHFLVLLYCIIYDHWENVYDLNGDSDIAKPDNKL